jgi:hypothetical protein
MKSQLTMSRRHFLQTSAKTIAHSQIMMSVLGNASGKQASRLPVEGEIPSLDGAVAWLNSSPLSVARLRGQVVLIYFWTYTCINWLRTLPYVRAWAKKYAPYGFTVIGVHTPEFSFEHDISNVRTAVQTMGIEYPVAVDSNLAIWNAFGNQYWPAMYFVDAKGRLRHHQFGEGGYAQSEIALQQLLAETKTGAVADGTLVTIAPNGFEIPADVNNLGSPETYLGYERSESFASPGDFKKNRNRVYTLPEELKLNHWALSGDWTVGKESVRLNQSSGKITFRFRARDLNLVMAPAEPERPLKFRVTIDGQPPHSSKGLDISGSGEGVLAQPRLYQLLRQPSPVVDRTFEIEFSDRTAEAYDFTFG